MTFTPAKWKSLNNAGNKPISGRKQREIASSIAYVSGRFSCAPFFISREQPGRLHTMESDTDDL